MKKHGFIGGNPDNERLKQAQDTMDIAEYLGKIYSYNELKHKCGKMQNEINNKIKSFEKKYGVKCFLEVSPSRQIRIGMLINVDILKNESTP